MNEIEIVDYLIGYLLDEMPEYKTYSLKFGDSIPSKKKLLRSLMNLRKAKPTSDTYKKYESIYLKNELKLLGIVDCFSLPISDYRKIAFWRGDIVRLDSDAIVNAGNSDMQGCFVPNHNCLDNEIHSYAGSELRLACKKEMDSKGHKIAVGEAFITEAYNLPSKYVIHVLGPSIRGRTNNQDKLALKKCYLSVLNIALENHIKTLALPCISTGEQGYPKKEAALIATDTVKDFIMEHSEAPAVIFDVYTDIDEQLYTSLLYE